jgi:hypothetical protein
MLYIIPKCDVIPCCYFFKGSVFQNEKLAVSTLCVCHMFTHVHGGGGGDGNSHQTRNHDPIYNDYYTLYFVASHVMIVTGLCVLPYIVFTNTK